MPMRLGKLSKQDIMTGSSGSQVNLFRKVLVMRRNNIFKAQCISGDIRNVHEVTTGNDAS